jgi:hypothetical protein
MNQNTIPVMWRYVAVPFSSALLLASLAGCQGAFSTNPHFDPDELPTKGSFTLVDTGDQKSWKLMNLQQVFINSAILAQNGCDPTVTKSTANNAPQITIQGDPDHLLLAYFDAGVALSDEIANVWFSFQFKQDRKTNHERGVVNIVGTTALGVLGFTGAEAKQLGLLGLGLAGINSEYQNYMAYFLVSPALEKIKEKFDTGRKQYAQNLRTAITASTDLTFGQVRDAIASYHNLCSRIEIQRIVTASVDLAKYDVPSAANPAQQTELNTDLANLHKMLLGTGGSFDNTTAKNIYVLVLGDATPNKTTQDLTNNPAYATIVTKLADLKKNDSNYQAFLALLRKIGPEVNGPKALADAVGATSTDKSAPAITAVTAPIGKNSGALDAAIKNTPSVSPK